MSVQNGEKNGEKTPHILNTSANLFGICAVLVTGARLTNYSLDSFFDEILLGAAFIFLASCFLSYLSIRSTRDSRWYEHLADYCFLLGLTLLFVSLAMLSLTVV